MIADTDLYKLKSDSFHTLCFVFIDYLFNNCTMVAQNDHSLPFVSNSDDCFQQNNSLCVFIWNK